MSPFLKTSDDFGPFITIDSEDGAVSPIQERPHTDIDLVVDDHPVLMFSRNLVPGNAKRSRRATG